MATATVGLTLYLPSFWYFLIVLTLVGVGVREWYGLLKQGGAAPLERLGVFGAVGLAATLYGRDTETAAAYLGVFMVTVFAAALLTDKEKPYDTASATAVGAIYLAAALTPLALIHQRPDGPMTVLLLMTANAAADIFAYYTGRSVGKTPLAPAISPKKTVEGALGGVVGAIAVGGLFAHFIVPSLGLVHGMAAGLIGGVIGPLGDLAESSLKRSVGAKDSGRLIPGHGGLLDRIDSLLFSAPCFYGYLLILAGEAG
jgi:phosphatidate cytidylyltransferase